VGSFLGNGNEISKLAANIAPARDAAKEKTDFP